MSSRAQLLACTAALGFVVSVGCQEVTSPVSAAKPVGPSPFETYDSDRLFVLVEASKFSGSRCRDYYVGPPEIREAMKPECSRWESDLIAYLQANGVENLESGHFADGAYFDWYRGMYDAIRECRERAARSGIRGDELRQTSTACNPWEKVRFLEKKSVEELEIKFPEGY